MSMIPERWPWIAGVAALLAVAGLVVWLSSAPPGQEPVSPVYLGGEVVSVDSSAQRLVLREGLGSRASNVSVEVPPATIITHAGTPLLLAEVRPGDHATVRLLGGSRVAQEIRLARAGEPEELDESPAESNRP